MSKYQIIFSLIIFLIFPPVLGRIHHLIIKNDYRPQFEIINFGFADKGTLEVSIRNFSISRGSLNFREVAFALSWGKKVSKTLGTDGSAPTLCPLTPKNLKKRDNIGIEAVFFFPSWDEGVVRIERYGSLVKNLEICASRADCVGNNIRNKRKITEVHADKDEDADNGALDDFDKEFPSKDAKPPENKQNIADMFKNVDSRVTTPRPKVQVEGDIFPQNLGKANPGSNPSDSDLLPTKIEELKLIKGGKGYSTQFFVKFSNKTEGAYLLHYIDCFNFRRIFKDRDRSSFEMDIIEMNGASYLHAGDLLKPTIYFTLAGLFFLTAVLWFHVVKTSKSDEVFRVHYLMGVLVILKALSLFFHGVNFYFISVKGHQEEFWAVIYYVMHLTKGALLFGTIILIGTGYSFFKTFLTDKERTLFMIVIPLQVIDNIALIVKEEQEEAQATHQVWGQILIMVDLICCVLVIIPVLWSIRHLQEASQTDGKALQSLKKLKLFRHFYLLIICYIYLTRVIKYLILIALPWDKLWLSVVLVESITWFFFVISGYNFRPVPNNPYLSLPQIDEEEMGAITQSGIFEGVTKRSLGDRNKDPQETVKLMDEEAEIAALAEEEGIITTTVAPSRRPISDVRKAGGPEVYS